MKRLKLKNSNKRAIVDIPTYERLQQLGAIGRLRLHTSGHVIFQKDGTVVYVHELVAGRKRGENQILVPINGKKTNLLPHNWAARKKNALITPHNSYTNRTGYRGVTRSKNKYRATISINGKNHSLGTFDTPQEAHKAYLKARKANPI